MEWMSFVGLDLPNLLPLSCFSTQVEFNHVTSVLVVTLIPLVGFPLISWVLLMTGCWEAQDKFDRFFLEVMLLAYPAISREISKCFRCDFYDAGDEDSYKLLNADL